MSKPRADSFSCRDCGAVFPKWMGKCLECGALNSVEKVNPSESRKSSSVELRAQRLVDLPLESDTMPVSTGVDFLDRILGGGVPRGTVLLVAGEPGIGKSTLLFQMLSQSSGKSLYVSAEESASQIGKRFRQLQKDLGEQMYILAEQRISEILSQMDILKPQWMVIDSIQMIQTEDDRAKGGMATIRDLTDVLVSKAKELGTILFIVGHVNKDGDIAGPKSLEHMVDTVLVFSMAQDSNLRILQTQKNRFGASGEVALLEISDKGLHETKDFDSYWTQKHRTAVYGCAVAGVVLGSRIVCVEIQALVVNSFFPSPRRSTSGFDLNRLILILAVLEKRMKIPFSRFDVYLNVVGGLKVSDPGADLAVAAALVSAFSEKALPTDAVYFGEIGLTGELRPPARHRERMQYLTRARKSNIFSPNEKFDDLQSLFPDLDTPRA